MAAQGRDIKLSPQRVEGYSQFRDQAVERLPLRRDERLRAAGRVRSDHGAARRSTAGSRTRPSRATREVTEAIEAYRFNDAASAIYRFVWNVYCDWYLELAKPVLMGEEGAAKAETRAMVAWARDEILKLLHPFMPFITEELWAVTAARDGLLVLAEWPRKPTVVTVEQIASMALTGPGEPLIAPVMVALDPEDFSDPAAEAEIGWVVDLVTAIRSVRSEMNIPPATLIPLVLVGCLDRNQRARAALERHREAPGAARRIFPLPIARRKARCSSWCAARSWRCRSRA